MTTVQLQKLKIGEGWFSVRVHGEPYVVATFKGYAPVLEVEDTYAQTHHFLYISAKSLMEALEPLRQKNDGLFDGLIFRIRKQSGDPFAKYEIEA